MGPRFVEGAVWPLETLSLSPPSLWASFPPLDHTVTWDGNMTNRGSGSVWWWGCKCGGNPHTPQFSKLCKQTVLRRRSPLRCSSTSSCIRNGQKSCVGPPVVLPPFNLHVMG